MATFYYRMQNCIQPDVYANAAFTTQQTIGQVYEMALVPPSGIIVNFCWKVDGLANDGTSAVIINDYGINGCSLCTGAPPPVSPPGVYAWAFHQVQGNGYNVKPTSCVNCPVTVYSNVSSFTDLTCDVQHFWLDAGLTTPFNGSNQYYNVAPNAAPLLGVGTVLLSNLGVVNDFYDCQGTPNCAGDCYEYTFYNSGADPLSTDNSYTVTLCDGSSKSSSVTLGQTNTECAQYVDFAGNALTVNNTQVLCNVPTPIAPIPPAPIPTPIPTPVPTAPVPSPVPTAPVPAPVTPIPDVCLSSTNAVTLEVLGGVNKYVFGGTYGLYGSGTGTFVLSSVPSSHPIAFQNFGLTASIVYDGQFSVGTKTGLDGNQYEYFYGDVTVTVTGNYGRISYECYNHGYMGGQNNLIFDNIACPNLQPPIIPPQGDPSLQYTLSYSDSVKGWPSFYSYFADWMIGMNNYFYSFKSGNLYRHNTNALRNNYYNVQYNSTLTSVFNEMPLENKLFKTINLESDKAWTAVLDSDIQTGASIDSTWFEKKEGAWFAFVRNNGTQPAQTKEYPMRSVSGIGRSSSVNIVGTSTTINFATDPLIEIGSQVSVGDIIYYAPPPYTSVEMAGQVTAINIDLQSNTNNIVINNSISGAVAIPIQDGFIMYIKNQQAESNGILGHYCLFTITNTETTATELFAVESEVMKSYP